jgi:hypothetical protein
MIASSFRNKPRCAEGVPMFWKYCSWHPHGKCPWDGMGAFLNIWQREMNAKWVQWLGKQWSRVLFNGRQPCGSFNSTYFLLNHLHIYVLFYHLFILPYNANLLHNIPYCTLAQHHSHRWTQLEKSWFTFPLSLLFVLSSEQQSLPTG